MPGTRCLKLLYLSAIAGAVVLAAVLVTMSYFPHATNLVRSRLATVDVVVVGGGLAGLSAAIEAYKHGARVIIIEKERSLGGNSAKATSGINGVGTGPQFALEIEDNLDLFIKDTVNSGGGLSNVNLVEVLARNSKNAIEFLMSFGLNLTDVIQLGGHSVARTHRIPPTADGKPIPVGFTIVSTLKKYVETELSGIVTVITSAKFARLLIDKENVVVGVEYSLQDGAAAQAFGNVILAAGGYANDHAEDSLLDNFVPHLSKLPTTNGPWATGDILKATKTNELSFIHLDQVQTHPTGFIEPNNPTFHTKFLAPEALRGSGAILLNSDGKRFVNELGRRDQVTHAIFESCKHLNGDSNMPVVAAMVMNEDVINRFGKPAMGFYRMKGIVQDIGSLQNLATHLKIDYAVLSKTIDLYQKAIDEGEDEFGKVIFPAAFDPKDHYYVAYITPSLHYCMGGLEIDTSSQVLRVNKNVFPGLFAAGEVTGGLHGRNRLGGNSLLDCVVFGRIAGQNAAHFVKGHS